MPENEKCAITAEDLYDFQLITDCRISPDGRHVVYSLQRVDRETEEKYANLWIVPTDGGEPRQFTYGDQMDGQPRWSPDGGEIAFLSNRRDEEQPQIHIIPFRGGEARPLTDLKGEFGTFEWSPDGEQLVCQFRKKDQEQIEREEDEHKENLGVVSRHVTRVFYKLDERGFLPKERWHIWAIDAGTGEGIQLTDSDTFDELAPRWSPDGKEIVFVSNHSEDPDLDPDAVDVFVMPAEGGEPRKIVTPVGPKTMPTFSPDGQWVAYFGREGRGDWWRNNSLWVVPADGSGEARNLTTQFDVDVSSRTINDLPGGLPLTPPTWSQDGQALYFQVSRHGNSVLKSVAVDGGSASFETVVDEEGVVGSFGFDDEQSKLAYMHGSATAPVQIWVREAPAGEPCKLTRVNEDWLQERDLGEIEEVWFEGAAGHNLQGWIVKPPGFAESEKYPAILEIHGGPRVQYGNLFMHEFYFLAAQGYVVFFCNPRGSQGYGEQHAKANWNNWGPIAYEDLMAWTDFVQGEPYTDRERLGVTGGSYGGYMTNWIIGHTDRFKAAVTQRSVSNLVSMYGSSDFNWVFQYEFGDTPPWEDLDNYWQQSPLRYIGNVTTPTLVIHSEQDLRCAVEQGEQVFVALKKLGVDTEMVRFPDEPHGLSRGGRTDRRIERLNYILSWFDRYLRAE
ncbi:MAG: Dipeptidyl-peptidase 5 [Anaerolineales bacterium]|nr:Dipeptidyl-peptidase 5 [Anaerolineales bacterium]